MVQKWPAVKVKQSKKLSVSIVKGIVFRSSSFDGWPFLNHWRHNVPHFEGLIMLNLDFEAQGHGSTFTFCHGHLKKAILP